VDEHILEKSVVFKFEGELGEAVVGLVNGNGVNIGQISDGLALGLVNITFLIHQIALHLFIVEVQKLTDAIVKHFQILFVLHAAKEGEKQVQVKFLDNILGVQAREKRVFSLGKKLFSHMAVLAITDVDRPVI
jgi:hypothetical protein